MQRSSEEKVNLWSQNRAGSIIMIGLSMIALMIMVKIFFQVGSLLLEQARLEEIRNNLQQEINDLEERNNYLSDSEYYSIYTNGNYQIDDDGVIIIPNS